MEALLSALRYLWNLEWTEKVQERCSFCDPRNFRTIVFEDDAMIAVENLHKAGEAHWLIIPKVPPARHVRDIEALTSADLPLLLKMDEVKQRLIRQNSIGTDRSSILCGYHRGRRTLLGSIVVLPDIVSIHHLHLHVIVEPKFLPRTFKYPFWLPFMWKSDSKVMEDTKVRSKPRMAPKLS